MLFNIRLKHWSNIFEKCLEKMKTSTNDVRKSNVNIRTLFVTKQTTKFFF